MLPYIARHRPPATGWGIVLLRERRRRQLGPDDLEDVEIIIAQHSWITIEQPTIAMRLAAQQGVACSIGIKAEGVRRAMYHTFPMISATVVPPTSREVAPTGNLDATVPAAVRNPTEQQGQPPEQHQEQDRKGKAKQ